MSLTNVVIVVLLAAVIFLVWERFHYRRRISEVYDSVCELAAGLERHFELRSHPQLRRYFSVDAILDDLAAKVETFGRWRESQRDDAEDES